MVSCQKGPARHAYTWQIGPFWQDTLELDKGTTTYVCENADVGMKDGADTDRHENNPPLHQDI